jgi:hypothetical protein
VEMICILFNRQTSSIKTKCGWQRSCPKWTHSLKVKSRSFLASA